MQLQSDGRTGIILAGSTNCTPAQSRYSIFEIELVGIVFAVEKSSFYIEGAQQATTVFTDHQPLASLASLDISSCSNNRVVRLVERLLPYDLEFEFVQGSANILADYMSHHPLQGY